ncbi:hypothetical protein [Kitasatospora sp. NPDC101183]|uniref:hypothetical protein n=1 Tax=Kitasatospora sp. NPDC101183 TaxID=3364100 RepID=UPI0038037B4B
MTDQTDQTVQHENEAESEFGDESGSEAPASPAQTVGRYALGGVGALLAFGVIATLLLSVLGVAAAYVIVFATK